MITSNPDLYAAVADHPVGEWLQQLNESLAIPSVPHKHGDWSRWQNAIDQLPSFIDVDGFDRDLTVDAVRCCQRGELTAAVEPQLRALMPWRKGPWSLHGIEVDTEWRSDWKWQRLNATSAINFSNKVVLDVGSGNGYFGYRMLGAGARGVLGIDPTWLFIAQFRALQKLLGPAAIDILPLKCEDLVPQPVFDIVCSMGVLYHRRSPFDHLEELKNMLRPGGELVLETLVIPGDENAVLVPAGRYMRMRNVWFLPSAKACVRWLERLGFVDVRIVDECETTLEEQRSTDWMVYESLVESLHAEDNTKTIEGYTAPIRAIITASKP